MARKFAVRNVRLCTKDCLCLYVCPTGATDTENSIIDVDKCIGCGDCADACPSSAISMVPKVYPPQQPKTETVVSALRQLLRSKTQQEGIARALPGKFAKALAMSNRLLAEDLIREAGYMLPQSEQAEDFLRSLTHQNQSEGFPTAVIEQLLERYEQKEEDTPMDNNKTLDNLMAGFAGESQANRKYTAYAKKAEKEGKLNAAKLFRAAADAETIHALKHFEVAGKVHDTAANLKDAVAGETYEYKEMYPDFMKVVGDNKAAAQSFTYAMKAEEVHAKLYQEALDNLDNGEEVFYYLCPVCGNIEKVRPDKCAICNAKGEVFIKY